MEEQSQEVKQEKPVLPNRKEVLDIMVKRGYTLLKENPTFEMMAFGKLGNQLFVDVNTKYNAYSFTTSVDGGLIKLSTEVFSTIEDDNTFSNLEEHFLAVLKKINS